ncbi:hypothetical protein [Hugenholtzia roseola]|uniref:hypothetical protein n=1 Tax=Hugenholtzia roseola TaxID=1002 RepID=UPI0013773E87|nr:hypothetical protein [Hugenholtzia roseola]
MHTHLIETEKHSDFLAQNRQDPITGDSIKAGDKVVFCAACKSVFLVETWQYLGEQHCGQSQTLEAIPIRRNLNIKSDKFDLRTYKLALTANVNTLDTRNWIEGDLPIEYKNFTNVSTKEIVVVFIISLFVFFGIMFIFTIFNFILLFILIVASIYLFIFFNNTTKKLTRTDKKIETLFDFFIKDNSILIIKESTMFYILNSAISEIYISGDDQYEDEGFSTGHFHVLITEKSGVESYFTITLNYESAKLFFNEFAVWSRNVEVYIKRYGLPTYGFKKRISYLMSHINYLINYREAKFKIW